jgi:hypothetical protein
VTRKIRRRHVIAQRFYVVDDLGIEPRTLRM